MLYKRCIKCISGVCVFVKRNESLVAHFQVVAKNLIRFDKQFCTWIVTEMDFIYDLYETNSVEEIKLASSKETKYSYNPF